jgi:hypothetical protein
MEPRRERRRRLTLKVAEERERLWRAKEGVPGRGQRMGYRSADDKGVWFWSTYRPLGCPCSKKHRGAPRRDRGTCKCEERPRIYKWRRQVRELNLAVTVGGYDPEDDLVSTLASARSCSNQGMWKN